MQITGYGYHHKHEYSAKKAPDKGQKRAFRPLRRKSNSPFQELKSDAQTNLRMLHGILFFYVVVANFTASKNEFKISSAQNVPKILFFIPKWTQKRLRGNLHEALFFNGREGGIRTHGGSSPHLISSFLNVDFSLMQIAIPLDIQGFHYPISPYIALFRSHVGCQKAVKFCT